MTKQGLMLVILMFVVVLGLGFWIFGSKTEVYEPLVTNFEECANAGNPIMESYPRQCRSVSGELFVEKINTPPEDTRVAAGYVAGKVTIGPSCPGPQILDKPCVTPPEAYTSREAVVYGSDGKVETRVYLDTKGDYKIALGPGNYTVQIVPAGMSEGEKKPFTVKSWETTVVNFDIDTGIR